MPPERQGPAPIRTLTPGPPPRSLRERCTLIFRRISSFFLGQGAIQAIGVLTSLYLVRALSLEAYAQFGLAFAFQASVGTLMDLGYTSTIIPLVGERTHDRALVGKYVRAAKFLRDRSFWLISPIASVVFLAIMRRHHWPMRVQLLLLLSVLASLYASGKVAYSTAPYFLECRFRAYYVPQSLTALGRLVGCVLLQAARALNSWTAAGLSALNLMLNGTLLHRGARRMMVWRERADPAATREVLHYVLPAVPAIVFAAFQTQIAIFLASIFGSTINIAQIAALGKLGQLFNILGTFNIAIVEPHIARLRQSQVVGRYLVFLLAAALCCAPLVAFAFLRPGPFVWLLGRQYRGLETLVGWVVLASCIYYLGGLMWIMNRARRWLFWSGTAVEIGLTLAVEIAFIALVGVRTTRQVVYFTLAGSFCSVATHTYAALYGFWRGPRQTPTLEATVAAEAAEGIEKLEAY